MRLLTDAELACSSVANCCMNRERTLRGSNGYEREIGFDPLERLRAAVDRDGGARWLDLCCGAGNALREAAHIADAEGWADRLEILGIDLVEPGAGEAGPLARIVRFMESSIAEWTPDERFDLITCVHGLHYVGDKLGIAHRYAGRLRDGGMFVANFDLRDIRIGGTLPALRAVGRSLRGAGLRYDSRRKRLYAEGSPRSPQPYRYLGADDGQGPNYTGQAAVVSHYGA